MTHGILQYYDERRRFVRRLTSFLSATSLALALLALGMFVVRLRHPEAWSPVILRFGFEGPTQYVQRIQLEQFRGTASERGPLGPTTVRVVRQKGGGTAEKKPTPRGEVVPVVGHAPGPGASDTTLVVRAVRRMADVPLVQSSELVIEKLVEPVYPEQAVRNNIEGRVQIQALVDTTGRVVEVQLFASTGEELLERAAEAAVWQCRFRPYLHQGAARPVYALFRFNFRIY